MSNTAVSPAETPRTGLVFSNLSNSLVFRDGQTTILHNHPMGTEYGEVAVASVEQLHRLRGMFDYGCYVRGRLGSDPHREMHMVYLVKTYSPVLVATGATNLTKEELLEWAYSQLAAS